MIKSFIDIAIQHRFKEIRPYLKILICRASIESTELYLKGLGESDVVQKEMYSFKINNTQYTLRPEFTACINSLYNIMYINSCCTFIISNNKIHSFTM